MKRLVALLLSILLCCTLFACGKKDSTSSAKNAAEKNSEASDSQLQSESPDTMTQPVTLDAQTANSPIGRLADETGLLFCLMDGDGMVIQLLGGSAMQMIGEWDPDQSIDLYLTDERYQLKTPEVFAFEELDDGGWSMRFETEEIPCRLSYTDPSGAFLVFEYGEEQTYSFSNCIIMMNPTLAQGYAQRTQTTDVPWLSDERNSFDGLISFLNACR